MPRKVLYVRKECVRLSAERQKKKPLRAVRGGCQAFSNTLLRGSRQEHRGIMRYCQIAIISLKSRSPISFLSWKKKGIFTILS